MQFGVQWRLLEGTWGIVVGDSLRDGWVNFLSLDGPLIAVQGDRGRACSFFGLSLSCQFVSPRHGKALVNPQWRNADKLRISEAPNERTAVLGVPSILVLAALGSASSFPQSSRLELDIACATTHRPPTQERVLIATELPHICTLRQDGDDTAKSASSMYNNAHILTSLAARLEKLNVLVFTMGELRFGKLAHTAEGFTPVMGPLLYARQRLAEDLAPLLERASAAGEPARVLGLAGRSGPGVGTPLPDPSIFASVELGLQTVTTMAGPMCTLKDAFAIVSRLSPLVAQLT